MRTDLLSSDIDWPKVACCWPDAPYGCQCGPSERALRGWISGAVTAPMTDAQRNYCLSEIASVEGYTRAEFEASSDADLARGVLQAWTDYCRDKGLL